MTDAEVAQRLQARFAGARTGLCVAALVAELIQSGRWLLDEPIAKHLPPGTVMPRQGARQILVRNLVTHSPGLPEIGRAHV